MRERVAAAAAVLVIGLILLQAMMVIEELLWVTSTPTETPGNLQPAPWEVSALLEEARKITEEASE